MRHLLTGAVRWGQVELLTFVFLIYPCLAAYFALYRLGKFSFYLLVPRHTSAYSLLANSMLMCRFGPPLAFNFMAAIAMPASKHDTRLDVTNTVSHARMCHVSMSDLHACHDPVAFQKSRVNVTHDGSCPASLAVGHARFIEQCIQKIICA